MKKTVLAPHITEKSMEDSKKGKFTFIVDLYARKDDIKKYVESVFNVDVVSINTLVNPAKMKRNFRTGTYYFKGGVKKAIVKLKKGQKIDLFETEGEA